MKETDLDCYTDPKHFNSHSFIHSFVAYTHATQPTLLMKQGSAFGSSISVQKVASDESPLKPAFVWPWRVSELIETE